ncbi:MAG: hypothetical protein LUQ04_00470 [Methanoregula sp.]|nr:hypothetical protein [Methanoregula sp.]
MKFSKIKIVMILLVMLAAVSSGCTDSAPTGSLVTTPQITETMTKTTTSPVATTAQQPAKTGDVKATETPVKIFNGDYAWVEYRNNNTVTMPPNPRYQWEYAIKTERSRGNYKGIPAIHYKITSTSDYAEWIGDKLIHTANGMITVSDRYYDISTNRFLGGTSAETIKGIVKPETDLQINNQFSREDGPAGYLGIEPFGEMNIALTYKGIETVTVPAGTYSNARKYTGNFLDGTQITFWVVPNIPVPVLYQFPNKYLDGIDPFQSYELKGWG